MRKFAKMWNQTLVALQPTSVPNRDRNPGKKIRG